MSLYVTKKFDIIIMCKAHGNQSKNGGIQCPKMKNVGYAEQMLPLISSCASNALQVRCSQSKAASNIDNIIGQVRKRKSRD